MPGALEHALFVCPSKRSTSCGRRCLPWRSTGPFIGRWWVPVLQGWISNSAVVTFQVLFGASAAVAILYSSLAVQGRKQGRATLNTQPSKEKLAELRHVSRSIAN